MIHFFSYFFIFVKRLLYIMEEQMNQYKNDLSLYLQHLLSTVTPEQPLEYFNDMYKSINPHCITVAKEEGKKILKNESKRGDKNVNVYLTLGGDSINKYLMEGIIAALLWLPEYIKDTTEIYKLSREEVDTTLKVLNAINLPKVFDAQVEQDNESETVSQPSNCRHYASFLIAIIRWLTSGITMFKQTGDPKTNMEMVRYLSATALNTFPSIPYCAYFIGQTKTNDMAKLAEKLAKSVDFNEFMTKEAYQINSPKFVVQTQEAPLVGISGHPLGELYVGMLDDTTKKTEWLGVFVKSEQFNQLCMEHGLSVNEVHEYVMGLSKTQHEKILQDKKHAKYKIAEFIEKQGNELIKTGFELFHKNDSKYFVKDEDFEKDI